jgi:hypothetical protein
VSFCGPYRLWSAQSLDVTFVWIPKCLNFNPNSGLTPSKSSRRVNAECTGIEQVLAALQRKKPAPKVGFLRAADKIDSAPEPLSAVARDTTLTTLEFERAGPYFSFVAGAPRLEHGAF